MTPSLLDTEEEIIRMERGDKRHRLENGLLKLYRRGDISEEQRDILLDAANAVAWDDAIHIAAPWNTSTTLCGNWDRNVVPFGGEIPAGFAGCWTCMQAAEWFEKNLGRVTA